MLLWQEVGMWDPGWLRDLPGGGVPPLGRRAAERGRAGGQAGLGEEKGNSSRFSWGTRAPSATP